MSPLERKRRKIRLQDSWRLFGRISSTPFRVLRKDRAYAAALILTLPICLGANTAIFTVVRSVLLRPMS